MLLPLSARAHRLVGLVAIASTVVACGGGDGGSGPTGNAQVPVTAIQVAMVAAKLHVGDTTIARATGLNGKGERVTLDAPTWSSSAPHILAVSAGGIVTASAEGEAMLTASTGGTSGSITVRIHPLRVRKVVLSRSAVVLAPTTSLTLFATTLDYGDGILSGREVTWSSADPRVAAVSALGTVTGVAQGTTTITATSEGATATASVTVTSGIGSVARIVLSSPSATLTAGETLQLTAIAYDAAGSELPGRTMTWSASVASGSTPLTISQNGLISALAAGSVIVEAECEGVNAAVVVTVRDNIDPNIGISFASPVKNELIGDTLSLLAAVQTREHVEKVEVKLLSKVYSLVRDYVASAGTVQEVWVLKIDVTDVPTGFYEIVATATVTRGAIGRGTITFQRDTRVGKGGASTPPKQK